IAIRQWDTADDFASQSGCQRGQASIVTGQKALALCVAGSNSTMFGRRCFTVCYRIIVGVFVGHVHGWLASTDNGGQMIPDGDDIRAVDDVRGDVETRLTS